MTELNWLPILGKLPYRLLKWLPRNVILNWLPKQFPTSNSQNTKVENYASSICLATQRQKLLEMI